ncbi:MAG TPA: ATP synthase subunit C [Firmicutes bacterium]|nr:ATP synthase subunit C [Bacillota bacterium]
MNALIFLLPLLVLIMLAMPLFPVYKGITTGKRAKRRVVFNLCAFFGVALLAVMFPVGGMVLADDAAAVTATASNGMGYLAAALSTGLSCIGAGIAVAAAAPAAIGAFSEDPKAFGKALIFVALGEGVALYGMLISILIINAL